MAKPLWQLLLLLLYGSSEQKLKVSIFLNVSIRRIQNSVKLQALVYDILPPTTALTDYAACSKNCQLTDSFLLVLKWQCACNRQLKLDQAFLL